MENNENNRKDYRCAKLERFQLTQMLVFVSTPPLISLLAFCTSPDDTANFNWSSILWSCGEAMAFFNLSNACKCSTVRLQCNTGIAFIHNDLVALGLQWHASKAVQNWNVKLFPRFRGKVAVECSKFMVKMPISLVNNENPQQKFNSYNHFI